MEKPDFLTAPPQLNNLGTLEWGSYVSTRWRALPLYYNRPGSDLESSPQHRWCAVLEPSVPPGVSPAVILWTERANSGRAQLGNVHYGWGLGSSHLRSLGRNESLSCPSAERLHDKPRMGPHHTLLVFVHYQLFLGSSNPVK